MIHCVLKTSQKPLSFPLIQSVYTWCSKLIGIVHVADGLRLLSGVCISLKDPTLAVAIECCLRSFMKAFCCDNYKDEAVLQELMSRYYPKGSRPQIIVSPFSDKVYNIHGRSAAAAFSRLLFLFLTTHILKPRDVFPSFLAGKRIIQITRQCWTWSRPQTRWSSTAWSIWGA